MRNLAVEDAVSPRFWAAADRLVDDRLVIDRPCGSAHPRYPQARYPLDYGYLEGTMSADGAEIDLWRGSLPDGRVTGALLTVDLLKRDAEIKLLVGFTVEEATLALEWHNSESQTALLVERP